jgi:catechol 2,3-dioxygenase-like lactoylglutathione lyase family enzyme
MVEPLDTHSGLGRYLQGVQHIGITAHDLTKSVEFYVEVLGGKLALSGDGFVGETLLNTMFQKELLEAKERGVNARTLGVANVKDGNGEALDVRFISFGNTIVELIHFRDAKKTSDTPSALNKVSSCVGFSNVLHLCFAVKDDVDLNQFALSLEAECRKRKIDVICNRTGHVNSEAERRATDPRYTANKFWVDPRYPIEGLADEQFGEFLGFGFFYCKGPNGEQLEFIQTTRKAKGHLIHAQAQYNKTSQTNFQWPSAPS